MTDHVKNQLCARIEELEKEKLELNEQLDAMQEERDGLGRLVHDKAVMLQRTEAERDALAAHVERLQGALELARDRISLLAEIATNKGAKVYAALDMWPEEMYQTLTETPTTSLARLKAKWQAEALEQLAADSFVFDADELRDRASELRRQAEGGEA